MTKTKKIISVNSLAAHKTASLKAQMSILGSAVLPVPTVILNGVGSYGNVHKQYTDLQPLLESTIDLALVQNQEIYLFIGYIGKVENISYLSDFVPKNKHLFKAIISDPISGDNGKPYINPEIILYWPQLLSVSDLAFPNLTELQFFSGLYIENESTKEHLIAFANRFPNLDFIVTSYRQYYENEGVYLNFKETKQVIRHKFYDNKLDGAGDVFSSYFLKNYLFQELAPVVSCKKAISQTLKLIQNAVSNDIDELIIL